MAEEQKTLAPDQAEIERFALAIVRSDLFRSLLSSRRVQALLLAVSASWVAPLCSWLGFDPKEVLDVLLYGAAPATTAGAILAIFVTYQKNKRAALAKDPP